jgi:hypothetical protein
MAKGERKRERHTGAPLLLHIHPQHEAGIDVREDMHTTAPHQQQMKHFLSAAVLQNDRGSSTTDLVRILSLAHETRKLSE